MDLHVIDTLTPPGRWTNYVWRTPNLRRHMFLHTCSTLIEGLASFLHDYIATTLSWPRTYMLLHSRHIASLTTVPWTNTLNNDATRWKLTNLLCLLSSYNGCITLSNLPPWEGNVFRHLSNCSVWICQGTTNQRSMMEHFVISRV